MGYYVADEAHLSALACGELLAEHVHKAYS